MAANFTSSSAAHLAPSDDFAVAFPVPIPAPRRRPSHLRVLEGGRSPRRMAKVYRRRRFLAVVVLLAIVLISVLAIGQALSLVGSGSPVPPASAAIVPAGGPIIVVQQGDTLSSIARRLQPSGSITSLVDRLAAAHGPGPLLAGDRLQLPR